MSGIGRVSAAERALPPLDHDEYEWAVNQLCMGWMRDAVLAAPTIAEAETLLRDSRGGGCGPRDGRGGIGGRGYWYDAYGKHVDFFFGGTSGKIGVDFRRGDRYTRLTWREIAERVRERECQEVLF